MPNLAKYKALLTEIDNSLGILQNCKMTKVMKICDRYIVWLLVQLGTEAHFRDALIVEQILYFTLIWDLHCTLVTDDNTACAAFTSTPERAHQKPNITVADVSEISASEHEIGRM
jgi:hypothetical protein